MKFLIEFRAVIFLFCSIVAISGFELTILHTNDVHARFEQFSADGSQCTDDEARNGNCYGGVARRFSKIQEIRRSHGNVLLLDAGDQFMGTTWFSVHGGQATAHFMNQLGYDAMCLGNHEFDLGVEGLVTFLDNVKVPVVSANTDVTYEPRLQGKFTKSYETVIAGEKIGIVGYITPETSEISVPGPTVSFSDVLKSVKEEVEALRRKGVNKIIALGHAGFDVDKRVAAIDGVDVVVGGHTNTFLYNGKQPSDEEIDGPYPVVISQAGGNKGLVVQDFAFGKYLGYLTLNFTSDGVVISYSGNPILLDSSVNENYSIQLSINEWRTAVDALRKETIGYSKVYLDGETDHCRLQECNLGNLITDAIIDYHVNYSHPESYWAPAAIALWNGGGIRSSINKGKVTTGELITVLPFHNEIDVLTVKGKDIRNQLEVSVSDYDLQNPHGRFLQMSGLRVVYNLQKPVGQRVVSVEAKCLECRVPGYSPLKDGDDYKVFLSTFLINGGDGYSFKPSKQLRFNTFDQRVLLQYFARHKPVYAATEGRIRFVTDGDSSGNISPSTSSTTNLSVFSVILLAETVLLYLFF